jgi:hypothetical protein
MRKNKHRLSQKPITIYGLDSLFKQLIVSISLPFVLLAVVLLSNQAITPTETVGWISKYPIGIFILLLTYVVVVIPNEFFRTCLIIFDDGIEIQLFGMENSAYWDELTQFGWKVCGKGYRWGILLNETTLYPQSLTSRIFQHIYDFDGFIPLDKFEHIPRISFKQIDLERFRKTPLGSDLYYNAPHLFDEAEAKPKHTSRAIASKKIKRDNRTPKRRKDERNPFCESGSVFW